MRKGWWEGFVGGSFKYSKLVQIFQGTFLMKKEFRKETAKIHRRGLARKMAVQHGRNDKAKRRMVRTLCP